MRRYTLLALVLALLAASGWQAARPVSAAPVADSDEQANPIYLPIIGAGAPIAAAPQIGRTTINVPYFTVSDITASKFSEMAVAWFGEVTPSANYADIRVGYNDSGLTVYLQIIDRRLHSVGKPSAGQPPDTDTVTLYLDTSAGGAGAPRASSYAFRAQFYYGGQNYPGGGYSDGADDSTFELSFQGDGAGWTARALPFYTLPGWDGNYPNDNSDDNGWAMTFRIPYSSLGLSGPPLTGSEWLLGARLTDRDDAAGTDLPDQLYPRGLDDGSLASWARLRFGLPEYAAPAAPAGTVTIRHRLNGATVTDAGVGGQIGALCYPGDASKWATWGTRNFGGDNGVNLQNQSKISDFPCYSKYYITFPLTGVPAGKVIVSAKLTLHQWGGSGATGDVPVPPGPSLIQVSVVGQDWNEGSINWNNALLPVENVAQSWAPIFFIQKDAWPGNPVTWDVSRAAAGAYAGGQPLRLVFYEADGQFHSGKFFSTSDTDDWNAAGRPTLVITWGNPR